MAIELERDDQERSPVSDGIPRGRARKIPFVRQAASSDCGAACLAMVLGWLGRRVRLDEVREITGYGRGGASAVRLLDAARWFGLRGRGLQVPTIDDLSRLDRGAILHWRFKHYVVFIRLTKSYVEVLDPAVGRRKVPRDLAARAFTGVALTFEASEDFQPGETMRSGRRVWSYLRKVASHSKNISKILSTSVLLHGFTLAVPFLIGLLVDRVIPGAQHNILGIVGLGLAAIVGFHFLSSLIRSHLLLDLRIQLDSRMTLDFLDHLVRLPYSFFQKRSSGDLMMRMNSNTTIREMLTSGVLSTILDGTLVTLYLLLLFAASPTLGTIVLCLGGIRLGVFFVTRKRHRDLMSQSLQSQADSQGYQVEILAGIETLKASGAEQRAAEYWSNLYVDMLNVSLMRGRLDAWVQSVLGALQVASPLVILFVGAHLVLNGELSLGVMLATSALATGFLEPLSKLVTTAFQLQLMGSYLDRIDDVLETPKEQDPEDARIAPKLHGRVSLDDVSFRYGPAEPLVVRNVSLEIDVGSWVAIVGRSGAGKSTLAALLVGLHEPTDGTIRFDGHDLAELDLRTVRSQIGIVPQHPYLFGHSIRANISLTDPTLTLPQVVEAARRAQIHDEVMAMPTGYEAVLADGGASLSGGQRQRVALARALAKKPAILLLDEATSSLDTITEARIHQELSRTRATRIVIAHRLSSVRNADQILVMEAGEIVERGTHRELLESGSVYRALVKEQLQRAQSRRHEVAETFDDMAIDLAAEA